RYWSVLAPPHWGLHPSGTTRHDVSMTLYPTLLWAVVIVLGVLLYLSKRGARIQASSDELRGRLAQTVTTWALVAIALLGIVIIAFAGYNASIPRTDVEGRRQVLDAAKAVFRSLLPRDPLWFRTWL